MKPGVGIAVLVGLALTTPARAFYTECTVTKDTQLTNRPGGKTDVRYGSVMKGDKVAFRDKHKDWWFVLHYRDGSTRYGWLPKSILTACKVMEGTP